MLVRVRVRDDDLLRDVGPEQSLGSGCSIHILTELQLVVARNLIHEADLRKFNQDLRRQFCHLEVTAVLLLLARLHGQLLPDILPSILPRSVVLDARRPRHGHRAELRQDVRVGPQLIPGDQGGHGGHHGAHQ